MCSTFWGVCVSDRRKADRIDLSNDVDGEWEMTTITSALKNYFRLVGISDCKMPNVGLLRMMGSIFSLNVEQQP